MSEGGRTFKKKIAIDITKGTETFLIFLKKKKKPFTDKSYKDFFPLSIMCFLDSFVPDYYYFFLKYSATSLKVNIMPFLLNNINNPTVSSGCRALDCRGEVKVSSPRPAQHSES